MHPIQEHVRLLTRRSMLKGVGLASLASLLGEDGLRVFLGEPRFAKLPVLLETGPDGHAPDKGQVEIAKRLRKKAGAQTRSRKSKARSETSKKPREKKE